MPNAFAYLFSEWAGRSDVWWVFRHDDGTLCAAKNVRWDTDEDGPVVEYDETAIVECGVRRPMTPEESDTYRDDLLDAVNDHLRSHG